MINRRTSVRIIEQRQHGNPCCRRPQIVAEEWGNKLLIYLYDESGSPIGMQYRTASYAEGVFDTYWFEKNLQGDIVAVYNDAGTLLVMYAYDLGDELRFLCSKHHQEMKDR